MPLTDLDDVPLPPISGERAPLTVEQFRSLPASEVPCGYFALTLTDGSTRRFRIRVERGRFYTRQRTLSRSLKLTPDDHEQWETIALVGAEEFLLFGRWKGKWEERWAVALWELLHDRVCESYCVEVERRCWMTMRELRDDDSRRTGLCREWRKRFGIK
jgi:hypothetical protein